MTDQTFTSEIMQQSVRTVQFDNGFTVQMCPMPGYVSAYAMVTAGVGSVDVGYRENGKDVLIPAGAAHYIEHKLFDCPYGDAMEHFNETGANANAMTSFDKTSYYFSCTDRFAESLDILLDFVSKPYFREESVEREKGIIAEEIRMYADSPDWAVMGNLLQILYQKHPVRLDIAGTVESIQQINAAMLDRCYRAFYRPDNMVLSVAGNFSEEQVLEAAEHYFGSRASVPCAGLTAEEPRKILSSYTERRMPVSAPIFEIGFKAPPAAGSRDMQRRILDELLLDLIAGEATDLYKELYRSGKINATFSSEIMAGKDFLTALFDGESRDPRAVYDKLCGRVSDMIRTGIGQEEFRLCKKANYGRYIGLYSREDTVVGLMAAAHFAGMHDIYYPIRIVREATAEQLSELLREDFDPEYSGLSVIRPADGIEETISVL